MIRHAVRAVVRTLVCIAFVAALILAAGMAGGGSY